MKPIFILLLILNNCVSYSQQLAGTWEGDLPVKINRPQEPKAPYSYDTAAVSFVNAYDQVRLAGTLTFPRQKGAYPAVILLTGSGPQNRDEEIMGHKPFKVIADYLTKKGIVVLRYDDRGVGESSGKFDHSTIGDFSKDAMAALSFLKKQKQVDVQKIGFIGHSEGGLIATLLAGQQIPDLSFILSLAGPAIAINELMVEQLYHVGKVAGMTEEALTAARHINSKNFELVKSDLSDEDAYRGMVENMKAIPGSATNPDVLAMVSPAYRYFMRIEPEKYLGKIEIPVFAAFGSLDIQVPSTSSLASLHRLLPKNPQSVLKEYEGLNHLFQQASSGSVGEYRILEETFNECVLRDMSTWIKNL